MDALKENPIQHKARGMSTIKKTGPTTVRSKATVRRLLSAVDRIILAAKQAERAREELAQNCEAKK